jgi:hypothetical protein
MKIVEIFTEQNNPVFYSTLTRAVQSIPQPKAPGVQWANMIANLTNKGVKQSEIEWSGVVDWLKQNPGPVTKDQVLQYIQSHEVQVHDTMHGVQRDRLAPDEQSGIEHGPAWDQLVQQINALQTQYDQIRKSNMEQEERYKTLDAIDAQLQVLRQQQDNLHAQMIDDTMKRQGLSGQEAQYGEYAHPGGKDYRELLLTTPAKQEQIQVGQGRPPGGEYGNKEFAARYNGGQLVQGVIEYPFKIGNQTGHITYWPNIPSRFEDEGPKFIVSATFMQNARFDSLEAATQEITQRYNNSDPRTGSLHRDDVYRGPHWRGTTNVLAHVRFDTRTDATGQKVLHVQEVQSDWHQAGRQQGYRGDPVEPVTLVWRASKNAENPTAHNVVGNAAQNMQIGYSADNEARGTVEFMPGFHSDGDWEAYVHKVGVIGHFPTEEEAKQAVAQSAAENNTKKRVAPGPFKKEWPQLAMKRMLRYAAEHGYDRLTWDVGASAAKRFDISKRVSVIQYCPGTKILMAWRNERDKEPVIKHPNVEINDLANYIGKEPAEKIINNPTRIVDKGSYGPIHILSGLDLKVGGEGMAGFYDQILPTMMNKYGKKWGVKVFQTKIDTANSIMKEPSDPDAYVMPNKRPKKRLVPAWGIDITPEMRDSILQGQPLWEQFIKRHVIGRR